MKQLIMRILFLILFIIFISSPIMLAFEVPMIAQGAFNFILGWNWMKICDYFTELYRRARRGE